jgi:hypothetical protein
MVHMFSSLRGLDCHHQIKVPFYVICFVMLWRLWAFANTIGGQLGGNNTQNHGFVNWKFIVNQHMCKLICEKIGTIDLEDETMLTCSSIHFNLCDEWWYTLWNMLKSLRSLECYYQSMWLLCVMFKITNVGCAIYVDTTFELGKNSYNAMGFKLRC